MNRFRKIILCLALVVGTLTAGAISPAPVAQATPSHGTLGHCNLALKNLRVFYPTAQLFLMQRVYPEDRCWIIRPGGSTDVRVNMYDHGMVWYHING